MNIFEIKVHPAADIFPMIPKDELEELAADIKANGLIHPIVVKGDILIDGRNRREACRIAGVTPEVVKFDGKDIESYIISSNINRRHMTKGQQAMAVAMVYPVAKRGRGNKDSAKETKSVSFTYIKQARTILKHLPISADLVLVGAEPLNKAYEEAVIKRDEDITSREDNEKIKQMADLADSYPDLAEKVRQEELSMKAALVEKGERDAKEKARLFANSSAFHALTDVSWMFLSEKNMKAIYEIVADKAAYKEHQYSDVEEDIKKLDAIHEHFEEFYKTIKGITYEED